MDKLENLKIAIGGIWHETNTFSSVKTTYEDFVHYQLVRDEQLVRRYRDTNTELGGIISEMSGPGISIFPTLYAAAVPSGIIERSVAMRLRNELVHRIKTAEPIDGVILALHGAAVAEGMDDFDAGILECVRQAVGTSIPIVATFDYHANVSARMVDDASVLIGYDTFPHTDMAQRGKEAARIMMNIIEKGTVPHCAFRKIPLLTLPLDQQTDSEPMRTIMSELNEIESNPEITCGSVAMGFPYCDVSYLGASVIVYGNSIESTNSAADILARKIWDSRECFSSQTVTVEQGVQRAENSSVRPVVIIESADNVGGGAAGDATGVLEALLNSSNSRSVVVVADPEAVGAAETAGVGNRFVASIGGKTDNQHGPTLKIEVFVRTISDGQYVHKGSYMTGCVTQMGRTAVVEAGNVQIVLTSLRTMPFDAEQLRCVGIEPTQQDIIVVKSAIAWKAAYGEIAQEVISVDSPGACPARVGRLSYRAMNRPLFPLDSAVTYTLL